MPDDPIRILIVEARFYDDLADALLEGATQALSAFGAEYDVVTVPGALEIPAAIAFAEEGGHRPAGKRYDGYVALGSVIRGETYHFEIVSNESARGIMGPDDRQAAVHRQRRSDHRGTTSRPGRGARISEGDKGGGAARAALSMVSLKQQLLGGKR
jgi:6,7-dimethyl-8-ribityllumazine synthase